jgi:hypothetical protein
VREQGPGERLAVVGQLILVQGSCIACPSCDISFPWLSTSAIRLWHSTHHHDKLYVPCASCFGM